LLHPIPGMAGQALSMSVRGRAGIILDLCLPSMAAQSKKLPSLLARLYLPALLALIVFAFTGAIRGIPMTDFFREPQMVAHVPFYVGVVSTLGCFLWAGAAPVCLFGWAVLRRRTNDTQFAIFLLFWGLLTVQLLLDDMFTFHECVYPYYFGIREEITYATYLVAASVGVLAFRKCIRRTDYVLLLLAVGFFGLKIGVDLADEHAARLFGHWRVYLDPEILFGQWRIVVEDGLKLFGIVSWLAYFWRCAFAEIGLGPIHSPATRAETLLTTDA